MPSDGLPSTVYVYSVYAKCFGCQGNIFSHKIDRPLLNSTHPLNTPWADSRSQGPKGSHGEPLGWHMRSNVTRCHSHPGYSWSFHIWVQRPGQGKRAAATCHEPSVQVISTSAEACEQLPLCQHVT